MKVTALERQQLAARLRSRGSREFAVRSGPFVIAICSRCPRIEAGVATLYANHELAQDPGFVDFRVEVERSRLRRWVRPQVAFRFDGKVPFQPLPGGQALPMLEWGLNWCIAQHMSVYLLLHAAVVERGGRALVLPGESGAGKSTLTAALVGRGWRLLTDELALVELSGEAIQPMPRPISLKNESIELIARFAPTLVVGPRSVGTHKGDIAHIQTPADAIEREAEAARPGWLVFPRWQADAETALVDLPKVRAGLKLARCGVNYHRLGVRGFDALTRLVDQSECYRFAYSNLEEAVRTLDALVVE